MDLPYAEDINYWKTGTSSTDVWIQRTTKQLEGLGGRLLMEAFGKDQSGKAAFMIAFEINGEKYKVVWPVLPSKTNNEKAARIQAATMLYHEVKSRCISATVLGVRSAFFAYVLLPDGRTAAELSTPMLVDNWPKLLSGK